MKTMLTFGLALTVASLGGAAMASSDVEAGAKVYKKCKACHVVDKEKNRVGPHLVGLMGRPVASVDGFKYSDAMKEWGAGKSWDVETLDAFLADPKGTVKGTKMSFRGLKKDADRANVIAYIESESP